MASTAYVPQEQFHRPLNGVLPLRQDWAPRQAPSQKDWGLYPRLLSVWCPRDDSLPRAISLSQALRTQCEPPWPPEPGNQGASPGAAAKTGASDTRSRTSESPNDPSRGHWHSHSRRWAWRQYLPFEVSGKDYDPSQDACLIISLPLRSYSWWSANRPSQKNQVPGPVASYCALGMVDV